MFQEDLISKEEGHISKHLPQAALYFLGSEAEQLIFNYSQKY